MRYANMGKLCWQVFMMQSLFEENSKPMFDMKLSYACKSAQITPIGVLARHISNALRLRVTQNHGRNTNVLSKGQRCSRVRPEIKNPTVFPQRGFRLVQILDWLMPAGGLERVCYSKASCSCRAFCTGSLIGFTVLQVQAGPLAKRIFCKYAVTRFF